VNSVPITASEPRLCVIRFLQQKKCTNTTSHIQIRSIHTPSPRLPMRDLNHIPRLHSPVSNLFTQTSSFPPPTFLPVIIKKGLKATYGDSDLRRYNAQPKAAQKDLPINNPSTILQALSLSLHPHPSPYPPSLLSSSSHTPHHEHPLKLSIESSRLLSSSLPLVLKEKKRQRRCKTAVGSSLVARQRFLFLDGEGWWGVKLMEKES
jgi:hypothetical protein